MNFKISPRVRAKLADEKHNVTPQEVIECFANRDGPAFRDERAEHDTDPMTQWFIAETDTRRLLKIVYIEYPGFFAIKSAYEANRTWIDKYEEMCAAHGA
ncbi:hypothetical protein [Luteimonas sp. YGD11-2]|uniref:hypothetical protein n=1 Tax=Luteimonas sp. YGD11-2 TaxID=2508168 RepID=UPI0019D6CFD0|nr:hypothetical protein [Luteimonas sp. YGD11-2]